MVTVSVIMVMMVLMIVVVFMIMMVFVHTFMFFFAIHKNTDMRAVDAEEKMMLLADEQPTPVELDEAFGHVGAEYCYEANDDEDDPKFDFRFW